ncbi:MAG: DUF4843 domain-containing protein [Chitinophagaceae bacterium]
MKKFGIFLLSSLLISFLFASCIKNKEHIYTGSVVELDAATWNANSVGVTYPILTRQPAAGRASSSANASDSIITRRSGTIQLRVNLVGEQRKTDTEITYVVDPTSTALSGTHFSALPGKVIIPANSSYGFIVIPILNPGATSGTKDLIITLTGGTNIVVNENYKTVGLRISQS